MISLLPREAMLIFVHRRYRRPMRYFRTRRRNGATISVKTMTITEVWAAGASIILLRTEALAARLSAVWEAWMEASISKSCLAADEGGEASALKDSASDRTSRSRLP